ncbi:MULTISPECIES: CoA ester lyase [unclassified Marivivens]|jgi:(3S)-malyl-CoA thioesterase|uniref:HpcH/HpaI aldolase/citrate lyase family protein n=1 Tax=unclassified Marivivens TaxID=2622455 RepID=UPI0008015102|nr:MULTISPECIES: CoA ester lyase [unclassified Marivivens]OBR36173.1 malyl-CoA thiolesterase [Donghicola sp. JL3646]APO87588.1 CoA ester lyase [Marivivens sp. JLT3646]NBT50219.1 CoA ester lyase [Marivivens sp.]NVJ94800.1 CoA ester lyase [Marivivens sp.]NVK07229.1 CoA ester lyase [Marivivens sp.]
MTDRPFRSALYIPGSKERALEKARGLPVDAILFDLEDAVAPDEKVNARHTLKEALYQGGYGNKYRVVRINGLDTEWGKDDAAETLEMECDAVLLPKVNSTADVDALAAIIGDKKIWAMMETPLGIINAASIAAHPSIEGFVLGTNDLAKDLNTRKAERREPLLYALQAALLAAKAYGVIAIDGVYNAFKDDEGLKVECEQGRDMGYDGKSLIHPAQVEITNAAFAPTEAEIELAQRQIAAFEEAEAQGLGVAVVDGKIVENLHIVTARATLAKAAAIAALDS